MSYFTENDGIVLYRDGQTVIGLDTKTSKISKVRCHPDDKFDFEIGARLALDKFFSNEQSQSVELKRGFSGKAVYIGQTMPIVVSPTGQPHFTIGKIYDFFNGNVLDDYANIQPDAAIKLSDETISFQWHFLPIVDDE